MMFHVLDIPLSALQWRPSVFRRLIVWFFRLPYVLITVSIRSFLFVSPSFLVKRLIPLLMYLLPFLDLFSPSVFPSLRYSQVPPGAILCACFSIAFLVFFVLDAAPSPYYGHFFFPLILSFFLFFFLHFSLFLSSFLSFSSLFWCLMGFCVTLPIHCCSVPPVFLSSLHAHDLLHPRDIFLDILCISSVFATSVRMVLACPFALFPPFAFMCAPSNHTLLRIAFFCSWMALLVQAFILALGNVILHFPVFRAPSPSPHLLLGWPLCTVFFLHFHSVIRLLTIDIWSLPFFMEVAATHTHVVSFLFF